MDASELRQQLQLRKQRADSNRGISMHVDEQTQQLIAQEDFQESDSVLNDDEVVVEAEEVESSDGAFSDTHLVLGHGGVDDDEGSIASDDDEGLINRVGALQLLAHEDNDDDFSDNEDMNVNETHPESSESNHRSILHGLRSTIGNTLQSAGETEQSEEQEESHLAQVYLTFQRTTIAWIRDTLDLGSGEPNETVYDLLRTGIVLCDLANTIVPGSIGRVARNYPAATAPFSERENISSFIRFLKEACVGVSSESFFTASDLHNQENIPKVMYSLRILSAQEVCETFPWPTQKLTFPQDSIASAKGDIQHMSSDKRKFLSNLENFDASKLLADSKPEELPVSFSHRPRTNPGRLSIGQGDDEEFSAKLNDVQSKLILRNSINPGSPLFRRNDDDESSFSGSDVDVDDQVFEHGRSRRFSGGGIFGSGRIGNKGDVYEFNNNLASPRQSAVAKWLNSIGMEQYIRNFEDDGWDEMEVVTQITEPELINMGITKGGHLRKILGACRKWTPDDDTKEEEKHSSPGLESLVTVDQLAKQSSSTLVNNGIVRSDNNDLADAEWRAQLGTHSDAQDAKAIWASFERMQHEFEKIPFMSASLWSCVGRLSSVCEEMVRYLVPYDVPIVVDLGMSCIKIGFAKDSSPRFMLPTVVATRKSNPGVGKHNPTLVGDEMFKEVDDCKFRYAMHKGFDSISEPVVIHWDDLEYLFLYIYRVLLRVSPSDHPLLVCEPEFFRSSHRDKLRDMLFTNVGVDLLFITKPSPLALLSQGMTSGVALNIGEGFSTANVVEHSVTVPGRTASTTIAGNQLTELLMRNFLEEGYHFKSVVTPQQKDWRITARAFKEWETARVLKEHVCFVAAKAHAAVSASVPQMVVEVESLPSYLRTFLPRAVGAPYLNIGTARCSIPEALFKPQLVRNDEFYKGGSLQGIIAECISRSPFSDQQRLWENIVICGGTSMCPGLVERLGAVLERVSPGNIQPRLVVPEDPSTAVWKGGARMASQRVFQRHWMSRSSYLHEIRSSKDGLCATKFAEEHLLIDSTPEEIMVKTRTYLSAMNDMAHALQVMQPVSAEAAVTEHNRGSRSPPARMSVPNIFGASGTPVIGDTPPATEQVYSKNASWGIPLSSSNGKGNDWTKPTEPALSHGTSNSSAIDVVPAQESWSTPKLRSNSAKREIKEQSMIPSMRSDQAMNAKSATTSPISLASSSPGDYFGDHAEASTSEDAMLAEPMKDSMDNLNRYMEEKGFPPMLQVDIRVFMWDGFATNFFGAHPQGLSVQSILAALPEELTERIAKLSGTHKSRPATKTVKVPSENDRSNQNIKSLPEEDIEIDSDIESSNFMAI